MALTQFSEQLKQDLRLNVERDNRTELSKIFTIYQRLDKLSDGKKQYLDTVIRQFEVQFKLLEKAPPICQHRSDLPDLARFFHEVFTPSAVAMISNEVKVGMTSGRIVDVLGPEHRFMMSRVLINDFLIYYKQAFVKKYLKRDFGEDQMFKLEMVKLVIEETKHLFVNRLGPVLIDQKLAPILEKLDASFFKFFVK